MKKSKVESFLFRQLFMLAKLQTNIEAKKK